METQTTETQYKEISAKCRQIFIEKNAKYGNSFTCLRPISFVTQLLNKVLRIKNLQSKGFHNAKIVEEVELSTFMEIYNYAIIGQMLNNMDLSHAESLGSSATIENYDFWVKETLDLMLKKNHDYGEAWRKMGIFALTDFLHTKLYRLHSELNLIKDNDLLSIYDINCYADVANYAMFVCILLTESTDNND